MIPYIVLSFFGGVALGFIICHDLIKKFARNLHFCSSTGRLLQMTCSPLINTPRC